MNNNDARTQLFVALSSLDFLRPKEKALLAKECASIKELSKLTVDDMALLVQRPINTTLWQAQSIEPYSERIMQVIERYNINFCTAFESEYPAMLRSIFDPPFMIFWRGCLDALNEPCCAIVGTRRPSKDGMEATYKIAYELVQNGITVVSGLALGIDTAAHRGAFASFCNAKNATKAHTVAVLASGVDTLYPAFNKALASSLIETGGAVLSEYPPFAEPLKYRFPARNRIISALSKVSAVMEAPAKSGALITAAFALEQGRDVVFHELAVKTATRKVIPKSAKAQKSSKAKHYTVLDYIEDGAPLFKSADELVSLVQNSALEVHAFNQEEFDFL